MGRPIESSPELAEHWASAPSHGPYFEDEDGTAPRSTIGRKLGWASLALLLALAGLLTAGYTLGFLDDWAEWRSSPSKIVASSAGGGTADVTGEAPVIESSAHPSESSSVPERERADSSARAAATAALRVPPGTAAEASEGSQVERLIQLLEKSEATWAEGYNAERQRADGVAKDLATVRAELADRVTAEASARAEVARMAKLLEAKETEWTSKLDAERKQSNGVAKDLASVRAELADRAPAKTSASTEVAQQAKLFEAKETEWTKKLDAERKRFDGAAKDLASVRAELADRATGEASARAEVARMAKLLEAQETEWTKRLDAERKRSDGAAKDLAGVRAELADHVTARTSARAEVTQTAKQLEAKETEWTKKLATERERADAVAKDLANVRAEFANRATAEASARTEVAQTAKLWEAKEAEWTKKLDAERSRSDAVAKDLTSVRAELANRATAESSARTEVAQTAKLLETKEAEWTKKLDAERKRSDAIAKDLASVRAELADRVTAEAAARAESAQTAKLLEAREAEWTKKLAAERERAAGAAKDLAGVRAELADRVAAEASARMAIADRLKTVAAPDPSRTAIDRGTGSVSTPATSAAEEARLIARAEFLIGQGDVSGARRFLERAVEGHSARAAFLLAETYDARILRTLQVYGVRGDTQRALELYKVASDGGIDKAKERISALKAENP